MPMGERAHPQLSRTDWRLGELVLRAAVVLQNDTILKHPEPQVMINSRQRN